MIGAPQWGCSPGVLGERKPRPPCGKRSTRGNGRAPWSVSTCFTIPGARIPGARRLPRPPPPTRKPLLSQSLRSDRPAGTLAIRPPSPAATRAPVCPRSSRCSSPRAGEKLRGEQGWTLRREQACHRPAPDLTHAEGNIYSKLAKVNDPAYPPPRPSPPPPFLVNFKINTPRSQKGRPVPSAVGGSRGRWTRQACPRPSEAWAESRGFDGARVFRPSLS